MDLSDFSMRDLLLAAIKSEVDSERVYSSLADRVENAFLKDRLRFLSGEEAKHRDFLENLFREKIGDEEINLPESTPVPLPVVRYSESTPVSEVMEQAMAAEKAAMDFYLSLALRFESGKTREMLRILSRMEEGHYMILEKELENLRTFEDYEEAWSMMHAGP